MCTYKDEREKGTTGSREREREKSVSDLSRTRHGYILGEERRKKGEGEKRKEGERDAAEGKFDLPCRCAYARDGLLPRWQKDDDCWYRLGRPGRWYRSPHASRHTAATER